MTNDNVDIPLSYDSMGHVKTTKLQNSTETSGKTISISAEYTADRDYLASQIDALGNTTSYTTNEKGMVQVRKLKALSRVALAPVI